LALAPTRAHWLREPCRHPGRSCLCGNLAAIQVDTPQGLGVNTETNGAFGEAGDVVELEALAVTLIRTLYRAMASRLSLLKYMVRELSDSLLSSTKPAAPACWARTPVPRPGPGWTCTCFAPLRSNFCVSLAEGLLPHSPGIGDLAQSVTAKSIVSNVSRLWSKPPPALQDNDNPINPK
jgi:hypothetical protein